MLDSAERGFNRLQIGCAAVFANLLFTGFCLWGAYAASVSWNLETNGRITRGTVIRMEESRSEGSCCVYSPVVSFEVADREYIFDSTNASDPPAYRVGQEVPVRYDPSNPAAAQIDNAVERWIFPAIMIPAMVFGALIFNGYMLRAWRRGEDIMLE
jgi:hypothetical protein